MRRFAEIIFKRTSRNRSTPNAIGQKGYFDLGVCQGLAGEPGTEDMVVVSVAVSEAVCVDEPAVGVNVTVPERGVVPFMNVTVPVGAAPSLWVCTTAVRVTVDPDVMVVALALKAVVVAALLMVTLSIPVLVWKLGSPG